MKISQIVALGGSLVTLVQILLLVSENEGICFNDGCEIVDSLTTVPPIFFNIGGFLFFQAIFWGIWLSRKQHQRMQYVNILLLAGLSAEAVLVSFQHFVAQAFCTYCLLILTFVVLFNLLSGLRHILAGVVIFTTVIIAFSSLQFSGIKTAFMEDLDSGSFAVLAGQNLENERYLFFSSSCKHCEKVIGSLKSGNVCSLRFNPIDEITDFPLLTVEKTENYSTDVNRSFLKTLGVDQVPVLLVTNQAGFQVVKGERPISLYLQDNCSEQAKRPAASSTDLLLAPDDDFLLPGFDDSCSIDIDCDDPDVAPTAK